MNAVINPTIYPTLTDTVILRLAQTTSPYSVTHNINGIVSTTGSVQFAIPDSLNGVSKYLVIRHRNSLETWSALPITLAGATGYNFTDAITIAFGNNLASLGNGKFAIWSGDVNQDGIINTADLVSIEAGSSAYYIGYRSEDITGERMVESADYSLIENNIGKSAMKP